MKRTLTTILSFALLACGSKAKPANTTPPSNPPASSAASSAAAADKPAVAPPAPVKEATASAKLEPRSGSKITGTADFVEKNGAVEVTVKIANATPGMHGVHLHETGDCSAADTKSAGGHFNPDNAQHGAPDAMPHHNGDLGNINVGADGTGTLTVTSKDVTVGPGAKSVVGKAVIVHAAADDLKSQPAGNSGARAACGVVAASAM